MLENVKFSLGQTIATKGVMELLSHDEIFALLTRHAVGDWGELCIEDKMVNELALLSGNSRLFSAYKTSKGKFWIITECDHSATTLLLPDEY